MIIPIGHEDGTVRRAPWVTLGIIAVCVAVQIAMLFQGEVERRVDGSYRAAVEYAVDHPYLHVDPALIPADALKELHADAPLARQAADEQRRLDQLTAAWRADLRHHPLWRGGLVPAEPRPGALVTHVFLHAGWIHLLANMLVLYLAGPFLEDAWGRRLYAAFYLAAGVFAGGMYALLERQLQAPLVGASGAVAGVLGAFLLLRGRSRIRFAIFLGFVGTFTAPAWIMLPLWFAGELLDALAGDVAAAGAVGVAYWAHVWGFLFGLAFAAGLRTLRPDSTATPAPARRRDPRLSEARQLLGRGLYPRAWTLLAEAARQPNPDPEALAAYWDLAAHLGREGEALPAGRELVRRRLRDGEWRQSAALLEQLASHLAGEPELAALRLRAAECLAAEDPQAAAQLLAAARGGTDLPPGLQAKAARLEERLAGIAAGTSPIGVEPAAG